MNKKEFKEFVEKWRQWYKNIDRVYSPCLSTNVIFNAKGFYHLRCSSPGSDRTIDEQVARLPLLPLAVEIIRQSRYFLSYRKVLTVEYWSFQQKYNDRTIRVILRRTEPHGQIVFHSVFEKKQKSRQTL